MISFLTRKAELERLIADNKRVTANYEFHLNSINQLLENAQLIVLHVNGKKDVHVEFIEDMTIEKGERFLSSDGSVYTIDKCRGSTYKRGEIVQLTFNSAPSGVLIRYGTTTAAL